MSKTSVCYKIIMYIKSEMRKIMNEELNLDSIREEIDQIDSKIVALYEQRMDASKRVAEYKIENGKKVFDANREIEKIRKVKSLTHNDFNSHGATELFEQIMSMSRKLQYQLLAEKGALGKLAFIQVDALEKKDIRVVCPGTKGAYTQAAMERFFGTDIHFFHVETFRDAMSAIDEGSADYAVLPIENSTAGMVSEMYDMLVEFENYIVGEQILKIEHCLLGLEDVDLTKVSTVYSHPQSFMQCAKYLREKGDWKKISMKNNAFAAEKVALDQDPTALAIAGEFAGEVYGLKVIEKGVQDEQNNSTRFIVVTNQKIFCKDAKKISICFEISHKSGSLYHMLSHFIYNNLNLTKIESRPIEDREWEYRFFIDFEGNLADSSVKNALRGLRDEARNMKILGNY